MSIHKFIFLLLGSFLIGPSIFGAMDDEAEMISSPERPGRYASMSTPPRMKRKKEETTGEEDALPRQLTPLDLGQRIEGIDLSSLRTSYPLKDSEAVAASAGFNFNRLPAELIGHILSFLSPTELRWVKEVSRFWYNTVSAAGFWLLTQRRDPVITCQLLWYDYKRYPMAGPTFKVKFSEKGLKGTNPFLQRLPESLRLSMARDQDSQAELYGVPQKEGRGYDPLMLFAGDPSFVLKDVHNSSKIMLAYTHSVHFFTVGDADVERVYEFEGTVQNVTQTTHHWLINVNGTDEHPEGHIASVAKRNLGEHGTIFDYDGRCLVEARDHGLIIFSADRRIDNYVSITNGEGEVIENKRLDEFIPKGILNTQHREFIYAWDPSSHMWVNTVQNIIGPLQRNVGHQTYAWPLGKDAVFTEIKIKGGDHYRYGISVPECADRFIYSPISGRIVFVESNPDTPLKRMKFFVIGVEDSATGNLMRHVVSIK